jgi:hypothetical protein
LESLILYIRSMHLSLLLFGWSCVYQTNGPIYFKDGGKLVLKHNLKIDMDVLVTFHFDSPRTSIHLTMSSRGVFLHYIYLLPYMFVISFSQSLPAMCEFWLKLQFACTSTLYTIILYIKADGFCSHLSALSYLSIFWILKKFLYYFTKNLKIISRSRSSIFVIICRTINI